MPKVIYIDENAVIIECEHIPMMGKWEQNVDKANQLEEKYCARCGLRVDSDLRSQELMVKTQGQKQFQLSCFSKDKAELVREGLREKGLIK